MLLVDCALKPGRIYTGKGAPLLSLKNMRKVLLSGLRTFQILLYRREYFGVRRGSLPYGGETRRAQSFLRAVMLRNFYAPLNDFIEINGPSHVFEMTLLFSNSSTF
jgi:hypothetical protein